ncbi:MAG: hypothetical protein U0670_25020 [Anaerolineae bacterium]
MSSLLERNVTAEEINNAFREEAAGERYKGILSVAEDELVSSDIVKDLACLHHSVGYDARRGWQSGQGAELV